MTNYLPQMYKALMPIAIGVALTALSYVGVTGQMTVEQALTLLGSAVLVWLVPNKK